MRDQKERIQNLAIYFVENTRNVGIVKLCKLFYFFDMAVYMDMVYTATGVKYVAEKFGPVPLDIWKGMKKLDDPFGVNDVIYLQTLQGRTVGDDQEFFQVRRGKHFCEKYFSPREIDILKNLCASEYDSTGASMSEKSHLRGTPWKQTWAGGSGKDKIIDFSLEEQLYTDTDVIRTRRILRNAAEGMEKLRKIAGAPC